MQNLLLFMWDKEEPLTMPQNPGLETPAPEAGHALLASEGSQNTWTLRAIGLRSKGEDLSVPTVTCLLLPTIAHGSKSEGVFWPPASKPEYFTEMVVSTTCIHCNILCISLHKSTWKNWVRKCPPLLMLQYYRLPLVGFLSGKKNFFVLHVSFLHW